jgi:hypothetical protein
MILKKLGEEYKLYSHDSCIATTQESPHKRLSKQNCDEIFGIVNLDKLVQDYMEQFKNPMLKNYRIGEAFNDGFNKAMELNKDKLFTVEDMISAYHQGTNDGASYESACGDHDSYEQMKEARKESEDDYSYFIESLQQPKEIEVDVEMWFHGTRHEKGKWIERLDENDCLILKKL